MNSLESKNVKNQLNQFYILNFQISTINKILAVDIKNVLTEKVGQIIMQAKAQGFSQHENTVSNVRTTN